jgi:hypothetical protein
MKARFNVITLEPGQEKELRELLSRAHEGGGSLIAEIRRDPRQGGDVVLSIALLPRPVAREIRSIIAKVQASKP